MPWLQLLLKSFISQLRQLQQPPQPPQPQLLVLSVPLPPLIVVSQLPQQLTLVPIYVNALLLQL